MDLWTQAGTGHTFGADHDGVDISSWLDKLSFGLAGCCGHCCSASLDAVHGRFARAAAGEKGRAFREARVQLEQLYPIMYLLILRDEAFVSVKLTAKAPGQEEFAAVACRLASWAAPVAVRGRREVSPPRQLRQRRECPSVFHRPDLVVRAGWAW